MGVRGLTHSQARIGSINQLNQPRKPQNHIFFNLHTYPSRYIYWVFITWFKLLIISVYLVCFVDFRFAVIYQNLAHLCMTIARCSNQWRSSILKYNRQQVVTIVKMLGYLFWNPYTPCWRFIASLSKGECDFQKDWFVEQLRLKFTSPLCNISLVQSTAEGVHISWEMTSGPFYSKLLPV